MSTEALLAAAAIFFTGLTIILGHDVFERNRRPSRLRVRIAADLTILKELGEGERREALQQHIDWQVAQLLDAEKSPAAMVTVEGIIRRQQQLRESAVLIGVVLSVLLTIVATWGLLQQR